MLKYPKVLINEKLLAFTVTYQETKDGNKLEEEMNEPNINKPYYISIITGKDYGQIKIVSDAYDDNLIFNFSYVYRGPRKDNTTLYHFNSPDRKFNAVYAQNIDFNDMLLITIPTSKRNSTNITYTISDL